MGEGLNIYYYCKDELCTKINLNISECSLENYTSNVLNKAFGVKEVITFEDVDKFLESRCFPRQRNHCKRLLNSLGLDHYDPLSICRRTHGVQYDDFFWLKFEDESLTWNDVKIRD